MCTGNICRSAYVEYALQAQLNALLGDRGRAEVTSAGTEPNQALTVPGPLLDLAPSRRVRAALTQHRPQQLTGRSLADQDLVLTATDDHLDEVLREDPAAVRRTFTILGMGTLLRDHGEELAAAVPPGAGVTALVTALAALRSRLIAQGSDRTRICRTRSAAPPRATPRWRRPHSRSSSCWRGRSPGPSTGTSWRRSRRAPDRPASEIGDGVPAGGRGVLPLARRGQHPTTAPLEHLALERGVPLVEPEGHAGGDDEHAGDRDEHLAQLRRGDEHDDGRRLHRHT